MAKKDEKQPEKKAFVAERVPLKVRTEEKPKAQTPTAKGDK